MPSPEKTAVLYRMVTGEPPYGSDPPANPFVLLLNGEPARPREIAPGLPEGIEVVEHSVCRAVGQWVLMVRCQCGKRWFELEAIDAATCPRCNSLVYVDVLQARPD